MAVIRIDASVSGIPEELAGTGVGRDRHASKEKLFDNMAEVLVFAALVGASAGRSKAVENPRSDPIQLRIFQNNNLDGYIYLLAIYNEEDFDILRDEAHDDALRKFEEYAFGGLQIISEWIETSGSGLYDSILDKMREAALNDLKLSDGNTCPTQIKIKAPRRKSIVKNQES